MSRVEIVRIPARLNHLGVTELYYNIESDDWRGRAKRLQDRRWHHVRVAMRGLGHVEANQKEHT